MRFIYVCSRAWRRNLNLRSNAAIVFMCPGDTIVAERAHGAFVHGSVWSERIECDRAGFSIRDWLDECVKIRLVPGAVYAEEPGYPGK